MPQRQCLGIDVRGRGTVNADRNGFVNVDDRRTAEALIANGGCFPVSNQPRAAGFVCTLCGFATWFKKCGRCGGPCEKET